jgi:hypothetical protein
VWLEAVPLGVEAGTGLRADRDVLLGYADVQARVLPVDGPASRCRLARGAP